MCIPIKRMQYVQIIYEVSNPLLEIGLQNMSSSESRVNIYDWDYNPVKVAACNKNSQMF